MASLTGDQERDTERSEQIRYQPLDTDNDVLVLQVRAFLEASEEVDIDVETVEDLMQTIPPDYTSEVDPVGDLDLDPSDAHDSGGENETGTPHGIFGGEELDVSVLYGIEDEAQPTWTLQEVKQMMHHLKERGMGSWITEYVLTRNIPIPKLLRAFGISLCEALQNKKPTTLLYFLKVALSRELRLRDKLTQYNTISDAVNLIRSSRRMIILTGAGISEYHPLQISNIYQSFFIAGVSCGIPDFRSRDGLYASLKDRGQYELDDPQQMFDINYFRENPAVFYSFASQIYPSNFIPSPCHRFIKLIEEKDKLLRNYTQNIDTLETLAGVQRVLQCHGSFATASCLLCRRRVPGAEIEADIMNQKVAICPVCHPPAAPTPKKKKGKKKAKGDWDSNDEDESDDAAYPPGIMKPDITFFGEKLTDEFDRSLAEDRERVDLLLVIGTSLKVSPVAEILSHLPHSVPQILINKTPIRHINPDIVLLGNADDIVNHLCDELGWELPAPGTQPEPAKELRPDPSAAGLASQPPQRVGDSHVWLFDGAEGGKWLQELRRELAAQAPPSLTPLVVDSGRNTRQPSPASAPAPGGEASSYRKREFLDVSGEERALKKLRAEQERNS
ncbi:SIR2-domain-containing protein [Lyophyllum atratum]|nr:SIR2-domain-containing protein [Lyophyllum atratum]